MKKKLTKWKPKKRTLQKWNKSTQKSANTLQALGFFENKPKGTPQSAPEITAQEKRDHASQARDSVIRRIGFKRKKEVEEKLAQLKSLKMDWSRAEDRVTEQGRQVLEANSQSMFGFLSSFRVRQMNDDLGLLNRSIDSMLVDASRTDRTYGNPPEK